VVREITPGESERLARLRARRPSSPETTGPAIREATGEIRPRAPSSEPVVDQPSILVGDEAPSVVVSHLVAPLATDPLVADLAALHGAVSTAVAAPPAPSPGDVRTAAREQEIAEIRKDAVAFNELEEAFFKHADHVHSHVTAPAHVESFEDLDEGYEPPKFWDRVFGRRRPGQPTSPPNKKK
jgi:hypothetical protein